MKFITVCAIFAAAASAAPTPLGGLGGLTGALGGLGGGLGGAGGGLGGGKGHHRGAGGGKGHRHDADNPAADARKPAAQDDAQPNANALHADSDGQGPEDGDQGGELQRRQAETDSEGPQEEAVDPQKNAAQAGDADEEADGEQPQLQRRQAETDSQGPQEEAVDPQKNAEQIGGADAEDAAEVPEEAPAQQAQQEKGDILNTLPL